MSLKKVSLLITAFLVCLALASCSNNEQATTDNNSTQTAETGNNTEPNQPDKEEQSGKQDDTSKKDEEDKRKDNSKNKENSSKRSDQTNKAGSDNKEKLLPEGTLEHGNSGHKVKQVQQVLNQLGYSLSLNSEFDWTMVWAIKDFQAQFSALKTDGVYGPETKKYIKKGVKGETNIDPGSGMANNTDQKGSNKQEDNSGKDKDKKSDKEQENANQQQSQVVSNPSSITVLVNKNNRLPADYIPENLVVPNVRFPFNADLPKRQMRQVAANALEKMFQAGDNGGVDLFAQSGYRSYNRQEAIFASNAREHGKEAANQFSAQAGESEHQTGLTMDVTSADINYRLTTDFANTDEGQWVKKHASEFGFIVRYPKGKTTITGYQYEPWHLRYVGKEAAQIINRQNITLEEYLGVTS